MDSSAARRIKGRGAHNGPDRSAEDLERRWRPNFLLVLLASLAIHAGVILFAITIPESYKKPHTIEISLVPVTTLPGPAGGGGKSEKVVKAPKVIKKETPPEKEEVRLERKLVEKKPPAKVKKEPRRLEVAKIIPEAPKGPGQGPSGGGSKPGKVVGPIEVEGGNENFPYQWYLEALQRKIGDRWRPPSRAFRNNPKVVIRFQIDRTGRIRDVKVDDKGGSSGRDGSSGMYDLDMSAQRAVIEANPVQPLPPGFPGDSLVVHYTFSPEKPS